jgi:F420H(2)-dependent quinone reductase
MSDALDWNARTIAEFRANEGRVGGNFAGAPMVLVHHRGRKSGREYVTPTMYLPHDTEPDVIYIFATKAGATRALPSTHAKPLESAPFPCSN